VLGPLVGDKVGATVILFVRGFVGPVADPNVGDCFGETVGGSV
jgi:hypothetical protein